MLDIKIIREKPEEIENKSLQKRVAVDIKDVLAIDSRYQSLNTQIQILRAERNAAAKEKDIEKGRELKAELDALETELKALEEKRSVLLLSIPNPAKDDVKPGKDDSENDVIKTYKTPTTFPFTPKDHLELGEKLGIIDIQRAAKVSGSRFAYLINDAVLLEFALVQYALETLGKVGFTPVIPPVLVKRETEEGLGYLENGGEEDMFVTKDDMFLVGTAEHSLVPMFSGETMPYQDLPARYVGFSTAFRREAGSYGKDTRGIIRVHQFDKVEMVSFVAKEKDDQEHDYLLSIEENFFQALDIPYRVIKMCSGDLGFPAARKYDIEAWMPGQNKYREVTSVSTVTDFQSRRLNIRYKMDNTSEYVYILNGTVFAIGRTIVAILENYQTENGDVRVPDVLQKYMHKKIISKK